MKSGAAESALDASPVAPADEQRFLVQDVPWAAYAAFRDALEDRAALRLTYREGALELMSPSRSHEEVARMLGRLVDAFAEERDLDLRGFRSTTFRSEARARGLEPDECFTLGELGAVPDLAIEVVMTAPLLDKLSVYAGLGVGEVWVWREGRLTAHVLRGGGYEVVERSALLPDLDLAQLAELAGRGGSQVQVVKEFRAGLRRRG